MRPPIGLLLRSCLLAILCLAPVRGWGQFLFYDTSSATLADNTVESYSLAASVNDPFFTATGAGFNNVIRCTAIAADPNLQKIFMLDASGQEIWSMNEDGSGLTSLATISIATPVDLALDTVNHVIYFATSSFTQGNNTIQKVGYAGGAPSTVFTASGASGNGVGRCTALALDTLHSKIIFSDAASNAIWSITTAGGSLTAVIKNLGAAPLDVALDVTNQLVYFVTSSAAESANSIERIPYSGGSATTLFTAPGTAGVQRCTGLDFDPAASELYLADAGADALWSLNANGSGVTKFTSGLLAQPRRLKLLPAFQLTVVNFNDSGPGSLRQAILNSVSPATIGFSNGLFATNSGVVNLATVADTTFGPSALAISNQITINGPAGPNGVVIARSNGAPAMRLFYAVPGSSLTLNNVTLSNGLAQGGAGGSGAQRGGGGGGGGGMGGAIFNYGATVALVNSTLVDNQAIGGAGGGTGGLGQGSGGGGGGMSDSGGLGGSANVGGNGGGPFGGFGGTNSSAGAGGGIGGGGGGGGSSAVTGSGSGAGGAGGFGGGGGGGGAYDTVGYGGGAGGVGGFAYYGGGGGGGGGGTPGGAPGIVGFGGGQGGATSDNTGNTGSAGGGGAGLGGAVFNLGAVLNITNCTFSVNAAIGGQGGVLYSSVGSNGFGLGGGIFNVQGAVDVLNGTFAFNQANQGGGGICNAGYSNAIVSTVFLRNTILADTPNGASDYLSTNYLGSTNLDEGDHNLIQLNKGFAGSILSTANPRLTPLQNNGGPTLTFALGNGSPAIDSGDDAGLPATDQRGYPRVADGDGNGVAIVDLGAVEDGLVRLAAGGFSVSGFQLFLTGETNRDYVTEFTPNLASPNWQPISTNLIPPDGSASIVDAGAHTNSPGTRFYRAYALP